MVKLLLEYSVVHDNIAAFNNLAFRWVASHGHLDLVNRLLEFPEVANNTTAQGNEAFRFAYLHGHMDVCHRLLDYPAVRAAVLAADNMDENLRTIAQDKESSMRALNLQEQSF